MLKSRAFRLFVAAITAVVVVTTAIFALLAISVKAEEPRNATPTEISTAALEGQISAMRKAGYDENCLFEVKIFGSLCIGQCEDGGFSLHLRDEYPRCSIDYCECEDEFMMKAPTS